ncbi:hypothetical protein HZB07_07455 [Candidatus Saganbacteria bacterium]|nr:hypothetical protein [Candidatus Saganbacteria bacterium]
MPVQLVTMVSQAKIREPEDLRGKYREGVSGMAGGVSNLLNNQTRDTSQRGDPLAGTYYRRGPNGVEQVDGDTSVFGSLGRLIDPGRVPNPVTYVQPVVSNHGARAGTTATPGETLPPAPTTETPVTAPVTTADIRPAGLGGSVYVVG